ncbi:MAG: methyltransferase domain-containing protein [Tissierellia bacterium]|nr:methyltransferase domain-containing protein [Tissierellia bacterium]
MEEKKTPNQEIPKDEDIRAEVQEYYEQIATGAVETEISPDEVMRSLGYDEKMLEQLPEGVNLGLSCGNPLDNLILTPGETLLDLGCGSGMDIFLTRMKYPEAGTLYGMDQLESMLARATKARDKKGFKDIEFHLGTLIEIPFEDNSIDKVISNCVINLEPNKQQVYDEIYRVLKPGGSFIISDILLKKPLSEELRSAENLYGT